MLAQIDLRSSDAALRLAAIERIGRLGDRELRAELEALLALDAEGVFAEPDEAMRAAASASIGQIDRKAFFVDTAANFFYGLSLASVLLLAALGLAITFGLMGVINMAHGEMLMLGAYTTYVVLGLFQAYAPACLDLYLLAAIPAAFVVCALVGMALERSILRFLYGRPLETLLATWGISLILIQTVRSMFGAQNVEVANPTWLSGGYEILRGVVLPWSRIGIVLFAAAMVAAVYVLLQHTRLGLYVRAVTQNRQMAAGLGIATSRVDSVTFGLGSGIAGLGGVALSQIGNVGPELGQSYIVDSFMVVVLGGVGKLVGTVVAAVGLGILNKFLEPVSGAVLGKIFVLGFLILFIQRRPQGIFALRGRAAEALSVSGARRGEGALHTPAQWTAFAVFLAVAGLLVPLLNLLPAEGSALRVPDFLIPLLGKFLCYAIVALAIDLIWGFTGILIARPRRLLRARRVRDGHAPDARDRERGRLRERAAGLHGVPRLEGAARGSGTGSTPSPSRRRWRCWSRRALAFVFGWFAFRSRITGVYFSIITQAMTFAFMLLFFRNNTGFGGNNGLTDFKRILGFSLQAPGTRVGLYVAAVVASARSPTWPAATS